jgi:hypothetical protein
MTSYQETILLDCNRLSSEEVNGSALGDSNPALFTNKVSSGLKLNIGDSISINSAYISERGAGGSVIEFKGVPLNALKTISYTETTNNSYVGYETSPTSYANETSETIDEELFLKDNEASFVIEYYKNTNGEGYITLPRNSGNASSAVGGSYTPWAVNSSYWTTQDGYPLGMNTYSQNSSHVYDEDWQVKAHGVVSSSGSVHLDNTTRGIRNNNERFTLFKMKDIIWNGSSRSASDVADWTRYPPVIPGTWAAGGHSDPACHAYDIYREKKTIHVDPGYDSPSNIAGKITDQLIATDNPIEMDRDSGIAGRPLFPFSLLVNGSFFKVFPASGGSKFNDSTNKEFFDATLSASGVPIGKTFSGGYNASAVDYLSSYAYVGFKRPKYIEQGRKTFAYHGNYITPTMSENDGDTTIVTNITWSLAVLQNLKDLFEIQHKFYPELITHGTGTDFSNYSTHNTTSASLNGSFLNEARFLHMGGSYSVGQASQPLGDDMYNTSYLNSTHLGDKSSHPIFIYFNNNSSHLSPDNYDGSTNDILAFGFAKKVGDYVAFVTDPIGGIPSHYYYNVAGADRTILDNTKIGYDHHFNAYGNAAIMLTNGYNYNQYYAGFNYQGYLLNVTYSGATSPLLNFDTVENRFGLSGLHTPERVGNFSNAGSSASDTVSFFSPPPSDQASNVVYKINKQLHYDTFSPSMRPYSKIDLVGAHGFGGQSIAFNYNLEPFVIYDSNCGVNIVDFGVGEAEWKDSLWGILGFTYDQFNPSSEVAKSINTRFNNQTTNVSGTTTNCQIVSSDSTNYNVNGYGVNMFNTLALGEINLGGSDYFAPSVIGTESTVIQATDLPRKTLRGYMLIKSDVLGTSQYLLSSNPLPIMAVVNKYSAADDFINYDGGGPVFTITHPKIITDIQTQILEPDGSLAKVGNSSSVIYKVTKNIETDLHFADNLLAQAKKKP